MHVVSQGNSSSNSGGGGNSGGSSSKRGKNCSGLGGSGGKGGGSKGVTLTGSAGGGKGGKGKGGGSGGTVYKIGSQKFTLDGKDGKTLDDVIEELVATSSSDRNWKGMFIATVVILAVLSLIFLSVIMLTPPEEVRTVGQKISFGEFLQGNLSGRNFNGTWISDTEIVYLSTYSSVVLLSVPSLVETVLVPNSTYLNPKTSVFGVSPDKKFVFLAHDYYKNFRYSFWAKYSIYEVDTGSMFLVSDTPDAVEELSAAADANGTSFQQSFLELFMWAKEGNAFVFVYRNNIYYKPGVKSDRVYPITSDGIPKVVFNGVPDWVYEEEILSQNSALWFSPDSRRLAFIRFDDSLVGDVSLPLYESPDSGAYVRYGRLRYPKAGTPNPVVSLRVVDLRDLKDEKTFALLPPMVIRKSDHYISGVKWVTNSLLSVIWTNREQNLSIITHCLEDKNWACAETYRETVRDSSGWVRLNTPPSYHPNPSRQEFLVLAPVLDGSFGQYRHVLRVKYGRSNIQQPVTQGAFEVTELVGWDQEGRFIYYSAPPEGNPTNLHLYRLLDPTSNLSSQHQQEPECLTCHLVNVTNQTETEISLLLRKHVVQKKKAEVPLPTVLYPGGCLYNEAKFSPDLKYVVVDCKGPDIPQVLLYESANMKRISELDSNSDLRKSVLNMTLPKVRTFLVPLSSGYNASVKLFLPAEISISTFGSYPLIVQVYAGPGTQASRTIWKHSWSSYLSSARSWIVAHIDGRGSGNDGDRRRFEVHKRLGTLEVQDQIEVTKYIVDNLKIVDPRRIAIWGWSYGGYASLMALSDPDQDVFQCGIAVAPVTNWMFYDSVYSERYMGRPSHNGNFRGYEESSVLGRAAQFRPTEHTMRKLMLIHGTRDDNVHMQHTMLLARELVRLGIDFSQQIYPDATHSLTSVRPHLYLTMESFIDECFLAMARDYDEMESMVGL